MSSKDLDATPPQTAAIADAPVVLPLYSELAEALAYAAHLANLWLGCTGLPFSSPPHRRMREINALIERAIDAPRRRAEASRRLIEQTKFSGDL
jgi:hypothetical protein